MGLNRSSGSSTSKYDFERNQEKMCMCKVPAVILTSRTTTNPFRRYYCCRYHHQEMDCRFFDWIDPEMSTFQRGCVNKVRREREIAEEQIEVLQNEFKKLKCHNKRLKLIMICIIVYWAIAWM
ncbi:uncharacterized protein LOC131017517 [Salvia miltiorrhiza]|uniref:uncharacterized protein LOC131017517 n=1 Tax=Salvia miltiorrhiza TaxID=226208 RepID=UPI0025AD3AE5|nr:uncharacterized protein LOC131017517 [Salvia miltiorrhiza]